MCAAFVVAVEGLLLTHGDWYGGYDYDVYVDVDRDDENDDGAGDFGAQFLFVAVYAEESGPSAPPRFRSTRPNPHCSASIRRRTPA